jgi:UDP-2-acetamido-3-amino-2,3-dideoxy-glucuronate N-acetyltransferase
VDHKKIFGETISMIVENNMTNIPKVAVIGAGAWGKNLIRNFAALGALEFVCDSSLSACAQATQSIPQVKTCKDYREILSNREIAAVVIATPAVTHYALAREALLAGKDVFVEKPLAMEAAEGRNLVDLANLRGRILMVGHILLYHSAIHKLKALVDAGELGKIQYVYSNRLNIGKIRSEENILWSFAPHDISVILWLLGEMPQEVSVHSGSYLQTQIADVTLTALSFSNGVKGHIYVSWLHPFKEQMLVIIGDRQMAVFDDVCEDRKLVLYPHQIDWIQRLPVARKAQGQVVPLELSEPLRKECAYFLDCIRNRKPPKSDGNEGLRVLEVLQACQRSMDRGGAPVILSESSTRPPFFIHATAVIDQPSQIGSGTKIWHFSHILKDCRIGEDCNIGQNVVIGPGVEIGRGCKIQNNVSIYQGVTIEDNVFCGPSMVFTNVFNPRAHIRRMDEVRPTLVQTGASIGANATIVCGITIGRYAFIGAGAVVTKDVSDYALMVGNPARQKGWMCACGVKLSTQLQCEACGQSYEACDTGLRERIRSV